MRKLLLALAAALAVLAAAQAAYPADFVIKKDGATLYTRTYVGTNEYGCLRLHGNHSGIVFNKDLHGRFDYQQRQWIDSFTTLPGTPTRFICDTYTWPPIGGSNTFRWVEQGATVYLSGYSFPTCVDVDVLGFISISDGFDNALIEINYATGQPWGNPTTSVILHIHTNGVCVN